jgi:hypothetical protein
VDFSKSVDFIASTGKSFFQSANAFNNHYPAAKQQTHKSYKLLFKDAVKYTCSKGYHVDMGRPSISMRSAAPVELTLQCDGKGKTEVKEPSSPFPSQRRCVPVTCMVPGLGSAQKAFTTNLKDLVQSESGKIKKFIKFEQTQEFVCNKGYSLDGTRNSEKDYTEKCEEQSPGRGQLTKKTSVRPSTGASTINVANFQNNAIPGHTRTSANAKKATRPSLTTAFTPHVSQSLSVSRRVEMLSVQEMMTLANVKTIY